MKSKLLHGGSEKGWVLVFDPGDEVIAELTEFARQQRLSASHFTAIGAFRHALLGFFNLEKKDYKRIPVTEQVEVLSLIGDVALQNDEPKIHAHVVLGKSDGSTCGGHLLQGEVCPTLEVILSESPKHLYRKTNEEIGLALIDLDGSNFSRQLT
jgi:predicted DNA-binding protein with PD1-like motif